MPNLYYICVMELLKEYYENKFRTGEMVPFEDLNEGQKAAIGSSFGFVVYQLADAAEKVKQEIKKSLCLN